MTKTKTTDEKKRPAETNEKTTETAGKESTNVDSRPEQGEMTPPDRMESGTDENLETDSDGVQRHPRSFAEALSRMDTPEIVHGIGESIGELCEAIDTLRRREPSTVCTDAITQLGKLRGQFVHQYPVPIESRGRRKDPRKHPETAAD